jgi:hypothetical protein
MKPEQRLTAARCIMALIHGKGDPLLAHAWIEGQGHLLDRTVIASSLKMMSGTGDFAGAGVGGGVASSFVNQVRDVALLGRLGMPRFPFDQRIFVSELGATAAEVAEGAGVPFSMGEWTQKYLRRRRFAGLIAQSKELIVSGDLGVLLALSGDLTLAVAEAVDRALLSPDATGSVFDGQIEIAATGTTGAQLTADILALTNAVATAYRDGRFVMTQKTAAFLATVNTTGVRFFPEIGVNGGRLLGLPVEISAAMGQPGSPPTACIGLVSPSMVLHAVDDRVGLEVSERATIQLNAAPSGDSSDGTAGTANLVSLWQAGAAAVMGTIFADWYARPGAGAFVRVGF